MIGLAIGGVILWAIAVVWGKKAAAWVVLVVCTVLVFAIALVIGRQLSGDIFDQIHAEHQAAGGSQFGGIPVNQFGDPVFTPPPLSSHQGPAATDEFGGVPVGDAFDQIQPDKFTPPPLSSYQGPAPPAPAGGDIFDRVDAEQKAQAGAGKLGAIK
jgi:Na+(H+)/acetate symporter ActP